MFSLHLFYVLPESHKLEHRNAMSSIGPYFLHASIWLSDHAALGWLVKFMNILQ